MRLFTFLFITSIICLSAIAQENKTGIPIPMKNGIVFYEKSFLLGKPVNRIDLLTRIEKWFRISFPLSKEKITVDPSSRTVSSKGLLKIITDEAAGHYYWIKPTITISVTDDSCIFQSYNYYEKPIMPGVTNDYSKIEYRWWDFRKGKPWNKEDEALFKGLDTQTLSMIGSFEPVLNK